MLFSKIRKLPGKKQKKIANRETEAPGTGIATWQQNAMPAGRNGYKNPCPVNSSPIRFIPERPFISNWMLFSTRKEKINFFIFFFSDTMAWKKRAAFFSAQSRYIFSHLHSYFGDTFLKNHELLKLTKMWCMINWWSVFRTISSHTRLICNSLIFITSILSSLHIKLKIHSGSVWSKKNFFLPKILIFQRILFNSNFLFRHSKLRKYWVRVFFIHNFLFKIFTAVG